jgi:hypothetical protein
VTVLSGLTEKPHFFPPIRELAVFVLTGDRFLKAEKLLLQEAAPVEAYNAYQKTLPQLSSLDPAFG